MYLVARFMGIRASEYNRMPWWEQKLYIQGLQAERPWIPRSAMMSKAQDTLDGAFESERVAGIDDDEFLSRNGLRVQTVPAE